MISAGLLQLIGTVFVLLLPAFGAAIAVSLWLDRNGGAE